MVVFLLKAAIGAGKLVSGFPFPDLIGAVNIQVNALNDFVNDMLDSGVREELEPIQKSLQQPEFLDSIPLETFNRVVGSAYKELAKKSKKDKRAGWKTKLTEMLDHSGKELICVSNEYGHEYAKSGWKQHDSLL